MAYDKEIYILCYEQNTVVLQKDRQEHNRPYRQRHPRRSNRLQTGIKMRE